MKAVLLCAAIAFPLCAQPTAHDIIAAARAALGGNNKIASMQSISVWGPDKRGGQAGEVALSLDLTGKFLREQTSLTNGGEITKMGMGEDGVGSVGGGMPGDDGGPALGLNVAEGLNGADYWVKNGAGPVSDSKTPEAAAANRKRAFVDSFARYAIAFTLAPPVNFPVTFTYAGQVEAPDGMADAIEGKGPNGFLIHLFIDAKTHLPLMMNYLNGVQDVQLWLKNYKAEDGILLPHTITWITNGNLTEEFQAQRFKINPKFPAARFQK
jgi:hypothetical protein